MAVSIIGPKFYAFGRDGKPLAFGKVYTYKARTNAPQVTYQSEDAVVANTNPVILNGEGYGNIYLDGSYKVVVKDKDDNEIWTADPVTAQGGEEWVNCMTATYLSSTTFKISGNVTDSFEVGRRVRIDNNAATYAYSTILSAVFAATDTTITLTDAVVTTGIINACVSIVGSESLAKPSNIETFADLRNLQILTDGQEFNLLGHTNRGIGGGPFIYDANDTKTADDNGITAITVLGGRIKRRDKGFVSFEDFGALEGVESSTAIESAINSGIPVRSHKRATPYIISRELTVSPSDIRGQETLLSFTSVSVERGLVFADSSGLTLNGFVCTTTGTVDQFVSGGAGSGILLERNVFDHAGCTTAMAGNIGGVHFDNIDNATFRKNTCKNGWRDMAFNAGNVGGNNLFRSIDVTNSGQKNVKFVDNVFDTVWSAIYAANVSDLHFRRNEVTTTADTAFFDRCTGSVTKVKRFVDNTFVDIGKAAIKTLDTNNNNDLVWGENSIVRGNTIDNWGLFVASECILSGRGLTSSYIRSPIKAKGLKLIDNECTQSTAGDTFTVLRLINIDDVEMRGNTFDPIDALGDEQIISNWCSNLRSSGDTWKLNGHLLLSFGHEGSFKLLGATVVSSRALEIEQDTLTVTQRFQISNCYIEATEAVPTGNVYGVRVISIPADFIISVTGNTFKPNIAFQDSNGVSNYNLIGLPFAAKQVIDNNIIEFTDQVAMQKIIAGDILNPVYFRGLPGAARLNGLSPIEYKGSTNATGDVFTLTQT